MENMLSQKVIQVCQEFGEEPIELPLENDGTLLLSTLNSAFPNATGIKFRNPINNCLRAVKLENNKFHSPGIGIGDDDGWESEKIQYVCVFPKVIESKVPSFDDLSPVQLSPIEPKATISSNSGGGGGAQPKTVDLIVLNLSSTTTEDGLREYFESKFGLLLMVELKRDRKTGTSRRFAFIRFRNYKEQMKALGQLRHKIDNQQVRLALPDFRDPSELYQENKCFVGRVNEQIKASDLRDFFSQYGDIVEVSYPKKFKGYAFITFSDPDIARKVCGQDFIVKGYSLCVSKSTHGSSKNKEQQYPQQQFSQSSSYQDFSQDWNNGWFQGGNASRDQWMPGQKYVTAPLNPSYGNANSLNPMVFSMAMQHANNILSGGYNNQYNRNNNSGAVQWNHQNQQGKSNNNNHNNNNNKKSNKQKKKQQNNNNNNPLKKPIEELMEKLMAVDKKSDDNVVVESVKVENGDEKNDFSEGDLKDLKQEI